MTGVTLNAADAAELAEMLQFLSDWVRRDPGRLGASLEDFAGDPAYGTTQLREDLNRFAFLLRGSDGEPLFGPSRTSHRPARPRLGHHLCVAWGRQAQGRLGGDLLGCRPSAVPGEVTW